MNKKFKIGDEVKVLENIPLADKSYLGKTGHIAKLLYKTGFKYDYEVKFKFSHLSSGVPAKYQFFEYELKISSESKLLEWLRNENSRTNK
jgi:hypothetical protein